MKLFNSTKNILLVEKLEVASNIFTRMRGLLGRPSLPAQSALWIHSCSSIHTFFMQFTIDVAFVDKNLRVKKIYQNIKPWRITLPVLGASSVIECPKGILSSDKIEIGDKLNVVS